MQISSKFAIFPRFVDSTNYLPTQVTLTLAKNVQVWYVFKFTKNNQFFFLKLFVTSTNNKQPTSEFDALIHLELAGCREKIFVFLILTYRVSTHACFFLFACVRGHLVFLLSVIRFVRRDSCVLVPISIGDWKEGGGGVLAFIN